MELKRYWEVFIKRKSIFIVVLVIPLLFAYILMKLTTPIYYSTTKVWIKNDAFQQGFFKDIPANIGKIEFINKDYAIGTIEELFESGSVVGAVISEMGFKNRKGNLYKISDFVDIGASKLLKQKKGVDIENISDSEVFKVVGYSDNPDEAKEISERVVNKFKAEFSGVFKEASSKAMTISMTRLKEMELELDKAQKALTDYSTENSVYNLSSQITALLSEKMNLQTEFDNNERNLAAKKSSLQSIKTTLEAQPEFLETQVTLEVNPTLKEAKKQLLLIEMEIAKLTSERTLEHPDVVSLVREIDTIKQKIKGEVEKTFLSQSNQRNSYLDSLITKYGDTEIEIVTNMAARNKALSQIREKDSLLSNLAEKERMYNQLSREVDTIKTPYIALKSVVQSMKSAKDLTLDNAIIIEPAVLSMNINDNRFFPPSKKASVYIMSLLVGSFMGILGIFFFEYIDETIQGQEDVKKYLNHNILTVLPDIKKNQLANIASLNSRPFYEALYNMLANLRLLKETPLKMLTINSSGKGEGKSIIAAFTAIAVASEGKKTLIIDADLRNARQHNIFGIENLTGLAEALEGKSDAQYLIHNTSISNLSILTAGKVVDHPQRLFASTRLEMILKSLSSEYDIVIIDTPSMDLCADALILSRVAGATVFIVRIGKTGRKKAEECIETMVASKIDLRGVIVNRERSIYRWP